MARAGHERRHEERGRFGRQPLPPLAARHSRGARALPHGFEGGDVGPHDGAQVVTGGGARDDRWVEQPRIGRARTAVKAN